MVTLTWTKLFGEMDLVRLHDDTHCDLTFAGRHSWETIWRDYLKETVGDPAFWIISLVRFCGDIMW